MPPLIRLLSCFRKSRLFFGCVVLVLCTACTARLTDVYIETYEETSGPGVTGGSGPVRVHYFFKRNESMGGFVGRGEDSEYIQALDLIWKSGDYHWENDPNKTIFYEYGTVSIDTIPKSVVQNQMKQISFYGTGSVRDRIIVRENTGDNRGPFGSLVDYLEEKLYPENEGGKYLYVVVSNLLEQNRENDVFMSFYRRAFARGLSGAFFAVDSTFRGNVFRFNEIGEELTERRNFDGNSTFFILVAGSGEEVKLYSERLSQEFSDRKLTFTSTVFPFEASSRLPDWTPVKPDRTDDPNDFANNKFSLVNLTKEIELYQWEEHSPGKYRKETAETQAYQAEYNIGLRYFAGFSGININESGFTYRVDIDAGYFDGKQKPESGKPTNFTDIEPVKFKGNFYKKADVPQGVTNPNPNISAYVSVDVENGDLSTGYYHIQYRVVPEAPETIVPDWVLSRNVDTTYEFRRELDSGQLKIIGFDIIYKGMAREFNRVADRAICSGDLYFVKYK